jgi:hypothetical protein
MTRTHLLPQSAALDPAESVSASGNADPFNGDFVGGDAKEPDMQARRSFLRVCDSS